MDETFLEEEKLYRAVYPPSHPGMFWKKDGSLSPAAFADPHGLSVERGYDRQSEAVIMKMKQIFTGCIVSVTVDDCKSAETVVKYCPTKENEYHSEIHSSQDVVLLTRKQRFTLAQRAVKEYMEE